MISFASCSGRLATLGILFTSDKGSTCGAIVKLGVLISLALSLLSIFGVKTFMFVLENGDFASV
jgi:hypothetical protein